MLGTCLANQHPDSKGLALRASTIAGPPVSTVAAAVGTVNVSDTPMWFARFVPLTKKQ